MDVLSSKAIHHYVKLAVIILSQLMELLGFILQLPFWTHATWNSLQTNWEEPIW